MSKATNPAAELAAMRKIHEHKCTQCGEPFEGIRQAKYCSEACKQRAKYARKKEAAKAAEV